MLDSDVVDPQFTLRRYKTALWVDKQGQAAQAPSQSGLMVLRDFTWRNPLLPSSALKVSPALVGKTLQVLTIFSGLRKVIEF